MKKVFVVLVLLSLGGTSLFSEVTVGGLIDIGVRFTQEGDDFRTDVSGIEGGDTDPHPPNAGMLMDLMINGNFETFGASVCLEYMTVSGTTPYALWAYGWVAPFGETLKIHLGRLDNYFCRIDGLSLNVDPDNDESKMEGFRVLVSPISGLTVGVNLVGVTDYGDMMGPPNIPDWTTENFFKSTLFGVKYDSEFFNVFATYKLSPLEDYEKSSLRYGFKIPINKFTILAEGHHVKGTEGFNYIQAQKLIYQITDPLSVSLRVFEKGEDISKFDEGLIGLRLAAEYMINPSLTVSGRVEFAGRQNGFEDPDTQLRARLDWRITPRARLSVYDNYKIVTKDGEENVNTIAIGMSCVF